MYNNFTVNHKPTSTTQYSTLNKANTATMSGRGGGRERERGYMREGERRERSRERPQESGVGELRPDKTLKKNTVSKTALGHT